MKYLLIFLLCIPSYATNWFISQLGSGSKSGLDINNCQTYTWLTNTGNWGSGGSQIANGDTVKLDGLFTNEVSIWGNVTVQFLTNAGIAPPAINCLYLNPTLSGVNVYGTQGSYISNSANGSALANQVATSGIICSGTTNVTISNIAFVNLYIHSSLSDIGTDPASAGAVYANSANGTLTVTGCTFSNVGWAVNLTGTQAKCVVTSNDFENYGHGIGYSSLGSLNATFYALSNHFGTTSNWDTTADAYHQDGIHYFGQTSNCGGSICSNRFDGNWGACNTAFIYFDTSPTNYLIANNLCIQASGNLINDGFFLTGGNFNTNVNNTMIGANVSGQVGFNLSGNPNYFANNYIGYVNTFVEAYTGLVATCNYYAPFGGGGGSPWIWNNTGEGSIGAWAAASGETGTGLLLNGPALNSSYQPTNSGAGYGYTLVGFGTNLSGLFTSDMIGNPSPALPNAWTVGALNPPPTGYPYGTWIFP